MRTAIYLILLLTFTAGSISFPAGGRGKGGKRGDSRPSSSRRNGGHRDDEIEILSASSPRRDNDEVEILSETGPEVVEIGRSEVWEAGRVTRNRNRSPSPSTSIDSGPPPCCDNCPRRADGSMMCECEDGSPCFAWNREESVVPSSRKQSKGKQQTKKKAKKRPRGDSVSKNSHSNSKNRRGGGGGGSLSVSHRRNPPAKRTRSR